MHFELIEFGIELVPVSLKVATSNFDSDFKATQLHKPDKYL